MATSYELKEVGGVCRPGSSNSGDTGAEITADSIQTTLTLGANFNKKLGPPSPPFPPSGIP